MSAKSERHMARVAALGCIACKNLGFPDTPAIVHHPRDGALGSAGAKKASDFFAIPLCPTHHQGHGAGVSYHDAPEQWERLYGTQIELLAQVLEELEP